MAHLRDVTFDCRHPASLARFWAEVLDGYGVAPYDEGELERLRSLGIDDPEDDPTVLVEGPEGRPRLFFPRVPEEKVVKNRVHLDLVAEDTDEELVRLEALGATRQADQPDDRFIVLRDPEGNELCLMR